MPTIYEVLEFGQIRKEIAAFAQSDIGRETSSNLVMLSKGELKNELAILDEMMVLNLRYGRLPMMSSTNLSQKVEYAFKGGTLTAEDLEAIAHDVIITGKIVLSFASAKKNFRSSTTNSAV
jgi:dsDNA-specific endonuclease/ATPase MutS2